jgi:NitT/TauT family transport system permease protein
MLKGRWMRIIPLIVFLLGWQIFSHTRERGVFFYGSPLTVANTLVEWTRSGVLWKNCAYTGGAVVAGFLIGNISGIAAGLILAFERRAANVVRPYLTVLGALPVIAFAPIIVIVFGIGFTPKIALAAFSTCIVAVNQTFEGALQTPPSSVSLLESLGASRLMVFQKIVVPSSLVWFFSGLRLNVGVAILAVFIGEFITAKAGVGYQIMIDMGLFKTSSILAGVVLISVMSLFLTGLISIFQRRFRQWLPPD